MKQICGSETNAAFTSAVNESGDFRFWHLADIAAASLDVRFWGVVSTSRRNTLS